MDKQPHHEKTRCCICGSEDFAVVYPALTTQRGNVNPAETFRSSGDEPIRDQVVRCTGCGLVYVNPRLKQEIIVKGYTEGEDPRFVSQVEGREKTFAKCLAYIMRYADKPGRVLDIGTAGGSFLAVAKRQGWKVDGIEPNRWMCQWAKKHYGLSIKQGTIEDHKLKAGSYDLVTLWDVLEHVAHPENLVRGCSRLLKNGGLLVVNYPDIGSWVAKAMKRKWVFLTTVHLWYFDRKTIRKFLEKEGFEVMVIKPHWQTLGLGYLATRFGPYSAAVEKLASGVVRALRLQDAQLPYWLGQTFVLARKR